MTGIQNKFNQHLLSVFILGSEVRQFVHSGLFAELMESGWSITIMSKVVDEDLKNQLPPGVTVIPLLPRITSWIPETVTQILDTAHKIRVTRLEKSSWQYGPQGFKNPRQKLLRSFINCMANALSHFPKMVANGWQLEKFLYKLTNHQVWLTYFKERQTNAILINVPRQLMWDPMLSAADELKIKTYLIYHTSKDIIANGRLNHSFTGIGVWNSVMKEKLLQYNPWIIPETVNVVGCGHFDCVGRNDWLPDEQDFRKKIGAITDSLLILYPTAGPGIVPREELYISLLATVIAQVEFEVNKRIQIVFRMNPMDDRDVLFEYLIQNFPQHIVLRPDWKYSRKINWCYARKSDPILYNALLNYADLCVTIPSTVNVDCAFANLPVINLGIEVDGEQPLPGSLRAFWEVAFNQNVRETQAARFVTTVEELKTTILRYLENKSLDQEKRRDLIAYEMDGILPGQSLKHSLRLITSSLSENH